MFGRVDMAQGQAMELVIIVILLALLEYLAFGAMVGRARGVYGIKGQSSLEACCSWSRGFVAGGR